MMSFEMYDHLEVELCFGENCTGAKPKVGAVPRTSEIASFNSCNTGFVSFLIHFKLDSLLFGDLNSVVFHWLYC